MEKQLQGETIGAGCMNVDYMQKSPLCFKGILNYILSGADSKTQESAVYGVRDMYIL